MTETFRLADQIRRAFEGNAWHGDSLLEILADVSAKTAATHPIKNAHSIWELLLHIAAWDDDEDGAAKVAPAGIELATLLLKSTIRKTPITPAILLLALLRNMRGHAS